ncbi:type IV pilus assembly protein PilM [Singulisphaera sp. PoT]|uniref:type IV pilus assembly protein PilM n=1 Tax=Singulisphaera sp. PoT TaxID=3411797 RepID=UPI003BF55E64
MAKIQPVWALDVGQAAVKALKLLPGDTPDQVVAEAFDYIEYPKILSQPDADPEQLVREALETFLERNELKGCKVAIAVPGQAGLVKFIKLPPVEKKRIPDIVKFEARQQIPFALEEVVWAYQQIGEEDEEEGDDDFAMAEVGLFAMKRDQINRAIHPFRVAGIEVDIVQMGPIALYNYITFDQLKEGPPAPVGEGVADADTDAGQAKAPAKGEKGSVVLIDIGADNTDLIITDGIRIWQRNVPIGGNHFTRALTKELKLTFAKAEHLKRNATKAPDPRSIFTAMRGVFNDFASEVNRSIGFYSSVNRNAKIIKVVGLGNGFKLPGLQKFLQQNLSHEIEKLENFHRMVGDDVKLAPQFQENLPSFGVAYGLAVQGLGKSGVYTNLLPPEIEQVRLIRAKKPWALAASALLMLGFSALFLGDYRVLAKVNTTQFANAVSSATSATKLGTQYKNEFDAAKGEWTKTYDQGKSLVAGATDRAKWPTFLKTLNANLPDPVKEYNLDPSKPENQPILDKLRVHIDAIKPVWRADVDAEWFSTEDSTGPSAIAKDLMLKYDRDEKPKGEGWIIQVVGHHYNPRPNAEELKKAIQDPRAPKIAYGPYGYLTNKVLPKLQTPEMRLYGIRNVTLGWISIDTSWSNQKGSVTNGLASKTVPLLDRATAPAGAEGGGEGMGPMAGMMDMMRKQGGGRAGEMGGMGGPMGRAGMMGGPMGMAGMMGEGMMGMGMMPGMGKNDLTKNMVTHSRTDFLIQFIWQPLSAEEAPKDEEEKKKWLDDMAAKLKESAKADGDSPAATKEADVEKALEKASTKQSDDLTKAFQGAVSAMPGAGGAAATPGKAAPGAPGATPAPAAAPGTAAPAAPGTPK